MARKPKQLILQAEQEEDLNSDSFRLHFDYSDSEYAEEHYGYYLMTTLTPNDIRDNSRARFYLHAIKVSGNANRSEFTNEFFDENSLVGDGCKHRSLSRSVIDTIFIDNTISRRNTRNIILGLRRLK